MKVTFHYTKRSHGHLRWSAYAIVLQVIENSNKQLRIETNSCAFKFGARRELRKLVRQHFKSCCRDFRDEEVIEV